MASENKHAVVDRMEKIDQVLAEYEKSIGLPDYKEQVDNEEITRYLNMSRNEMERLDPITCAEIAATLGALSFHIQRSLNRENARLNWAKSTIKEIICSKAHGYTGSWGNQDMQAILDNDVSRKLHEISKYCQQRIDRLTYLSNSLKNMSDLFVNLQRAKVMNNG